MTNPSAMTALQSLAATNKALETTQSRISTGLRVAQASDNAAYWSIATTMRSDNKALSTVQDALGLGASRVDVTYTAMNDTINVIDEIKKNVLSAKQPGLDKQKIQSNIAQLVEQLRGSAVSATFSGPSWLSINSAEAGFEANQQIVSSFSRGNDGTITVGTLDIDVTKLALFDANPAGAGLLDGRVNALSADGDLQNNQMAAGDGAGNPAQVTIFGDMTGGITFDGDAQINFSLVIDGTTYEVAVNKKVVNDVLGVVNGTVADATEMATVLNSALRTANVPIGTVTVAANGSAVEITHNTDAVASTLVISDAVAYDNGSYADIADIDVTNANNAQLDFFIASIDKMLNLVTVAASELGAVKSRIDMQKQFTSSLMDSIERGVGQLVDADMSEESTRLQALQVQQQLGIQALSIANSTTQNILSLFRS